MLMDMGKVEQLVELKKERVLVGDGELPLLRGSEPGPLDMKSIDEYRNFLEKNRQMQFELESTMTQEEVYAAEKQYVTWFREYLSESKLGYGTTN